MSIQPHNLSEELQRHLACETKSVSVSDTTEQKLRELHDKIIGLQIKQGVTDTWRMEWLEKNPRKLQCILYKGKPVWFVDAERDFPTAREAIDFAISQLPQPGSPQPIS
jgi:hypothetical protein